MNELALLVIVLVAIALGAMVGYAYGWRAGEQEANLRLRLERWAGRRPS